MFRIEHECRSGKSLLDALAKHPTDIVITDFSMSQREQAIDGFAMLRKLRDRVPDALIVLLTAQTNSGIFARAINLGVRAVVSKEDDTEEVVRAATAAGPLQFFGFESGGLTELYRELVSA